MTSLLLVLKLNGLCCCLQASLSAKTAELDSCKAHVGELELRLAQAMDQGTAHSQRLATLQVSADAGSSIRPAHTPSSWDEAGDRPCVLVPIQADRKHARLRNATDTKYAVPVLLLVWPVGCC